MNDLNQAIETLKFQRLGLNAALTRYLASPEGEILAFAEKDFAKRVMTRVRPAIVLLAPRARGYLEACQLGKIGRKDMVFILNTAELRQAQSAFAFMGPLFKFDIGAQAKSFIGTAIDYDPRDDGDYAEDAFELDSYPHVLPALVSAETVRVTAPHVEDVFTETATRSLKDTYYWDQVRAYENWVGLLNQDRRYDGVLQVGGWPEYVQDGEADEFIAQLNIGVGDSGSLYLQLGEGKLKADLQQY